MLRVDTHYHASPTWFEPVEVFIFHMDRCGIDKGVLVQHRGEFDNTYLLECARRYPDRISAMGLVDHQAPDAAELMGGWADEGIEGFRFWFDREGSDTGSRRCWQKANELGLPVTVPATTEDYASVEFEQLVRAYPGVPFIIEHMAVIGTLKTGSDKRVPTPPFTTFRAAIALAKYPNVFMKVTGFGELMGRPQSFGRGQPPFDLSAVPPLIDMCVESFGADHMMIGTDSTSSAREGYANVWRYLEEYLSRFSVAQREAILGGTAVNLFPFRGGTPA